MLYTTCLHRPHSSRGKTSPCLRACLCACAHTRVRRGVREKKACEREQTGPNSVVVGSLNQHAVRSCGHCGEMPLKIMLNVRDTQTRSSRRWVPLSTAKPIYCNTSERSINLHTNRHCHKSSLLLPAWQGNRAAAPTPLLYNHPATLM